MRGKASSTPPQAKRYKVVKARDHGGLIHGARREAGDTFEAPESAMTFELLEGIVEEVADAKASKDAATKPAAPKAEEKAV